MNRSTLLDDDSGDSDIDNAPTFRQERAETKKRQRGMDYLDGALEEQNERRKTMSRITKIKQEEPSPDKEQLKRAEDMANERQASGNVSSWERQRQAHDIIHGIETDGNDGLDHGRLTELANLATTNRSDLLGTRQLFYLSEESELYQSIQQLVEGLKEVLKKMDGQYKVLASQLRKAIACDMLGIFLEEKKLVALCKANYIDPVPPELQEWLWKVACSAGQRELAWKGTGYCVGAFNTLQSLWNDTSSAMSLCNMPSLLKAWFGLQLEHVMAGANPNEAVSDGTTLPSPDLSGLRHFLLLWKTALANGEVADEAMSRRAIDDCIVALTCAGLDRSLYSEDSSQYPTLRALENVLVELTDSLVPEVSAESDLVVGDCMQATSRRIVETCQRLGPGAASKEDFDDDKAWLCLPKAVFLFAGSSDKRNMSHGRRIEFMATLAMAALRACLLVEDWDKSLESHLSKKGLVYKNLDQVSWKALASVYVALCSIRDTIAELEEDSPRCLAIVELVRCCLYASMTMLKSTPTTAATKTDDDDNDDETTGSFKSQESARQVYGILDVIDSECQDVKKLMEQRASIPHFRRAEFSMTCMVPSIRLYKDEAADHAGDILPKKKVQKGIDAFFARSDADSQEETLASP